MSERVPTREIDVVVIGAGAVGENVADYAHRGGLSTALVESELVGGECSYWACMPSKALLRTADAVVAARRLPGVTAEFDVGAVLKRRDAIAHGWDDASQVEWAEGAGIPVVRGRARLAGERLVEVGGEVLRARHAVVLATGSRPSVRRSPAWTPSAPGPAATPRPRTPCRVGWACWAAGSSAASWRRPGGGSGRRWCCWSAGRGCCSRRSPWRRRRSPPRCAATAWTCGWAPGSTPSRRTGTRSRCTVGAETLVVDELLRRHRPSAERRRPRAGDGRPRRAADRRRHRAGAGCRRGVAVRRGRRHRAGAADPPGQVRRADRRRGDRRAGGGRAGGHGAVGRARRDGRPRGRAAGGVHRPGGRVGRADRGAGARRRAADPGGRPADRGGRRRRSSPTTTTARCGWSSTTTAESSSG